MPEVTRAGTCAALALLAALAVTPARAQGQTPAPAGQPAAPDFQARWLDRAGAVSENEQQKRPTRRGKEQPAAVAILQLGDSHTAADFFTGELRRRLQALFGNGGAGYMAAGRPHAGVRSSTFKITATPGWAYKSLFKANEPSEFWLSGYNAIATESGQTIAFESDQAVPFDSIEIETVRQPGGGAIDIKLDGRVESSYNLNAETAQPIVIRLDPAKPGDQVKQVSITTTAAGTVNLASVSVFNRRSGLTYNAVGFPGAQVSLLDKFDERVLSAELNRIAPHIVVLAFGTNEGVRDELDYDNYARLYERVVLRIQSILPNATMIIVGPPDSRERSSASSSCGESGWRSPPALARVREIQEEIAKKHKLVYWNWASIMPEECGAHRWAAASPPLMAKDHVHFTIEGYKKSAGEFLNTLIPIIKELRARSNVVSNN